MTTAQPKTKDQAATPDRIVNDFSMTVGTMNGSGSQTSNLTLLRALFKMGIPVTGKNLFPSNIQGLPTWYTIRASKDGYLARRETHEIVVAMNRDTFVEDFRKVVPGGAFFYADDLKFEMDRDDIAIYPMPAKDIMKQADAPSSLRDYLTNMVYVGVLAQMLDIDMEMIRAALEFHFEGKEKAINLNMSVIERSAEWAKENLEKKDPYHVEPMDGTDGYIMTDGNTAAALGSIYGGVQFLSWYPITPASSLAEHTIEYLPGLRDDPKDADKKTYAVVQAEDELSAIGMAVGAGWAGLRSMTSTSGPGISLMTEFIGLGYYSEIPVVIWDVQRMGPSTGLPTRTSQGDLTMVYYLGHGDTHNLVLLPGCPTECFEFGWKAFDIAERVQTPVFVLSDLDMGMNQWMTRPFEYPETPMDRGKVIWEEDLDKWTERWGRYLDKDGDGITYRTIPGNKNPKSAYFARGTGHNEYAAYTERGDDWEKNMERLVRKFETARQYMPAPQVTKRKGAKIAILSYGSTENPILEALDRLEEQEEISVDFIRVRALPFPEDMKKLLNSYDRIYVVEMNRDGQMHQILKVELPTLTEKIHSVVKGDGLPLTARFITDAVAELEKK